MPEPERLALHYTVHLLGFSPFERESLASCFRLAEARSPAYIQAAQFADADFAIVDADQPAAVAAVRQADRLHDAVFVGAHAPHGAGAHLPRPISPSHLVRELDLLLEQRLAALEVPGSPDWVASEPGALGLAGGAKDVLVVDDSRIALRFLQVRLQRRGYRVQVASTPEEALARLEAQPFALVFLDVALGPSASMDGLALCQRIKQGRHHPAEGIPRVVMVSGLSSSSDKVRGALAGCDAYLTKPLMEDEFAEALRLLDPSAAAA
jgi:two-component system cell cycle response regulator